MPARTMAMGMTGKQVASNVAQIRRARGLSLRALSRVMEDASWPLSADSLNQIELGSRRVDVDELVALAAAFEIEPAVLLAPVAISTQITVADSSTGTRPDPRRPATC